MRKAFATFLQAVIVLIGIGVLVLMLWEPHLEGRNVHATTFQIYFNDPFLAYAYAASIAFFIALYQAVKLLGCAGRNEVLSQDALRALRVIKVCAMCLIGCLVGAEAYFILFQRGEDDIAGGVMLGLLLIIACVVVATAAKLLERRLQVRLNVESGKGLAV